MTEPKPRKKKVLKRRIYPTPNEVAEFVTRAAEKLLHFKPTGLVAVNREGLLTARLIQHYIKRKKKLIYPVYHVEVSTPEGLSKKLACVGFSNPAHEQKIHEEEKLAVIHDVKSTGLTWDKVKEFLLNKTVLTKLNIRYFPLVDAKEDDVSAVFHPRSVFMPTQTTRMVGLAEERAELYLHQKVVDYFLFKNALDTYMNRRHIGKDPRKRH